MKVSSFAIVTAWILLSLACQKSELEVISLKGKVFNSRTQMGIEGATLTLQSTLVTGGVYHSDYRTIAVTNSSADGSYVFNIETEKAVDYRVLVDVPLYFDLVQNFNPEDLKHPEPKIADFTVDPMAWLTLKVNNVNPWNMDDLISFSLDGSFKACSECCNSTIIKGEGPLYQYTQTCAAIGTEIMRISWTVTKKNNTKFYTDSLLLGSFDTATYQINY